MGKKDNFVFLTQGAIDSVIWNMAFPTIISMVVIGLYNIADTFFVGRINTQSTAAVGVVFSLMFFIQAISFFFGNGSGNYISRELGAQRRENAEVMATTGFYYALFVGMLIMILGELFLRPLSLLLGSTTTILPYTERYLEIILLGTPFAMGAFTLNNQMRFQGNAHFAMRGIVSGALLNVLLDPLFIFVFKMGITGAAVATVIGQVVSFLILLAMTYKGNSIRIRWRRFSFSSMYIRELFAGGTPSILRQGLMCVATIMLNLAAGAFGDAAIAAMSIVNRFTMILMAAVIGFGQGFQPFCGFCYGAKLYVRVKKGFWYSVKICTIFLIMCSYIGWRYADVIVNAFRSDMEVVMIGTTALKWQLATLPMAALLTIGNMLTQTIRKTWRANFLAALRNGLFFVPLILVLPSYYGLLGVQMCQAWSTLFSFVITIPILYYTLNEIKGN